jgi:hypothetical protein
MKGRSIAEESATQTEEPERARRRAELMRVFDLTSSAANMAIDMGLTNAEVRNAIRQAMKSQRRPNTTPHKYYPPRNARRGRR